MAATYRSAVIVDDGAAPAIGHHRTARPGERAPHVWFRDGGGRRSTLDLFDGRLTVLAGPRGGWDLPRDVPITLLRVGHDLPDPRGVIQRAYRLAHGSAVLVRPDGVVAWRHDGLAPPRRGGRRFDCRGADGAGLDGGGNDSAGTTTGRGAGTESAGTRGARTDGGGELRWSR